MKVKRVQVGACSFSPPSISPPDWLSASADLSRDWYVQFYYFDPLHTKGRGKFFIRKTGINEYHTLKERRIAAKAALAAYTERLRGGWNPVTGGYVTTAPGEVVPDTAWFTALPALCEGLRVAKSTKGNVKSAIKKLSSTAVKLGFETLPLELVKLRHVKILLDTHFEQPGSGGPSSFNHYRAYLVMLFKQAVQLGAVDFNPARELSKRKETKRIKDVIPTEHRRSIVEYFSAVNPDYLLFLKIFFSSGARPVEVLSLKAKDVSIDKAEFKTTVYKGSAPTEYLNPIPDAALKDWALAVSRTSGPGDYLFGPNFRPGSKPCKRDYATRYWQRHVKGTLGLPFDQYTLKHTALDEISELIGVQAAADKANHTSAATTIKHYLPGETKRRNDKLRKVGGSLDRF